MTQQILAATPYLIILGLFLLAVTQRKMPK
jgi:hypothetical protein